MPISHCYQHLVVNKWQFHIANDMLVVTQWQFHIANDMLVVENGNLILLMTSNGQEWQFDIANDI